MPGPASRATSAGVRDLADPSAIALKAAVAVAGTLALVRTVGLEDPISATFAALVCVSPVAVTGFRVGVAQVVTSALGGAITAALLATMGRSAAVLALAMGLTIWGAFAAGFARGYLFGGFTVLYVFLLPASSPTLALEQRLVALGAGMAIATLVNTLVGALFSRAIFRRRVNLIRLALAAAFDRLVAATQPVAADAEPSAAFDDVFPLLWALGSELSDARRGRRFRRRSLAADVDSFWLEVRALARLAHFGKELGLRLESARADHAGLADALRGLASGLRDWSVLEREPPATAAWGPTWLHAVASLREANEARLSVR